MSNVARVAATAANTLTKPLNVEEVFSTYLYNGNGSSQTITNGIDLDGEGGAVIFKSRTTTEDWHTYDTERGTSKRIALNTTTAQYSGSATYGLTAFNSNGFSVGTTGAVNGNGIDLASWTFRKAPKFFDVVTYTGTGSARSISHNLNADVGMLIVKSTSSTTAWRIWTNSFSGTERLQFDTSAKATTNTSWDGKTPTSTEFYLGADTNTNNLGTDYVAYLFAHNDGDGDFGPTGDQDIIKCGVVSHTQSNGSDSEVNLGFEPQWLLIKNSNNAGYAWAIFDTMRGWTVQTEDNYLTAESSGAEGTTSTGTGWIDVTSTGFKIQDVMFSTGDYIYIAIRRGPMAVPESATDVFAVATGNSGANPDLTSGFPVDFAILRENFSASQNPLVGSRLQGANRLKTPTTDAESAESAFQWDFMDGWFDGSALNSGDISWMWKRAPNFCDVVTYKGTGVAKTVNHNLGVAPEMMWIKSASNTYNWEVYYNTGDPSTNNGLGLLRLNKTAADLNGTFMWNNTHPTDSVFSIGTVGGVNSSGGDYIAYLFASLAGVSKVGSYTGNGTSQVIDCGFTAGARFVLIKRTDSTGSWCVFDSERGIVAGNDPVLYLQLTNAEVTTIDWIDPNNSGFEIVTSQANINANGGSYIFYAIA